MENNPLNNHNRLDTAKDVAIVVILGVGGATLGAAGVDMAQHSEEISTARMAIVDGGAFICTASAAWLWQEMWRD